MTSSNDKLKAYDFDMNLSILRDTINSYRGCRLGERIAEMKRIVKWFGICKNMEMLRNNKKREEHRQEVLDYAKKVIDSYDHQQAINDKKEMDLEDAPKHIKAEEQIKHDYEAIKGANKEENNKTHTKVPNMKKYEGMTAEERKEAEENIIKKINTLEAVAEAKNKNKLCSLAQELKWAWNDRNLNYDGTEEKDEFKRFMNSQNYIYGIDSFHILEKSFIKSKDNQSLLSYSNELRNRY